MTEITREQFFDFIKKKDDKEDDIDPYTQHYLNYFDQYQKTRKIINWNWGAAAFSHTWLIHRKMFLWAFLYYFLKSLFWGVLPIILLRGIDSTLMKQILLWILFISFYFIPGLLGDWVYLSFCRRKIAQLQKKPNSLVPRASTNSVLAGAIFIFLVFAGHYLNTFEAMLVSIDVANGNFYSLASMYRKEKNYRAALIYMQHAANKGNLHAQCDLGVMYVRGDGVEKDYKKALGWFYSASGQGHARASYILYDIFTYGEWFPKDVKKAKKFLFLSAEQGYKRGQYYVGIRYLKGDPSPRKIKKAVKYLQLSAAQGYRRAQYYLGLMHSIGVGVEKNDNEAISFLKKAMVQRYSPALAARHCIESKTCNREVFYKKSLAIDTKLRLNP